MAYNFHYHNPDPPGMFPFELKGKTIEDIYRISSRVMIIEFTDGTKVKITNYEGEIIINKK